MTASFGVADGTLRRPEMRLLSRASYSYLTISDDYKFDATQARTFDGMPRQPQSIEYTNNRLR
ncbi:hypothetical protein ALC62_06161 [Cyphomyrmex costatus]|uniref:Uncharacterized protein n=1 Tax=Cyphomyrmex costatus TaxID=456900 RepID=A0A195CQT6_9HYME|nr:hypothetical protein ALC62_06161 [Cyphomyrmex costatus]